MKYIIYYDGTRKSARKSTRKLKIYFIKNE